MTGQGSSNIPPLPNNMNAETVAKAQDAIKKMLGVNKVEPLLKVLEFWNNELDRAYETYRFLVQHQHERRADTMEDGIQSIVQKVMLLLIEIDKRSA